MDLILDVSDTNVESLGLWVPFNKRTSACYFFTWRNDFAAHGNNFFHNDNYQLFWPGQSSYVDSGVSPVSGDTLQLSIMRSGASCAACDGDTYSNDFSGSLDSCWVTSLPWGTSGGLLVPGSSNSTPHTIMRPYNCVSASASYTVKFCLNGSLLHTGTFTASLTTNPISGFSEQINAGIWYDHWPSDPITVAFDNFLMDVTT